MWSPIVQCQKQKLTNIVTDGQTARLRDYIYKYFCGN